MKLTRVTCGAGAAAEFVGRGHFQSRHGLCRLVVLQVAGGLGEGNEDLVEQGIGGILAYQLFRHFLAARGVSGLGQHPHDNCAGAAVFGDRESLRNFLARFREVTQFRLAASLDSKNDTAEFLVSQALGGAFTLGIRGRAACSLPREHSALSLEQEQDGFVRLSGSQFQFVALGSFIAANKGEVEEREMRRPAHVSARPPSRPLPWLRRSD